MYFLLNVCFSETWQEKNKQVRKKIRGAFVCDMHNIDMLSGTLLDGNKVDAVTACLCMGASNPDGIESFRQSLKNFRYCILDNQILLNMLSEQIKNSSMSLGKKDNRVILIIPFTSGSVWPGCHKV